MSVEFKKYNAKDTVSNPLLARARFSTPPSGPPELHWVLENDGKNYILWQPADELPAQFSALSWRGPEKPRLLLTIELWQRYRQLSPLEKAYILQTMAGEDEAPDNIPPEVSRMLSIPNSEEWLDCYRKITELSSNLQEAVHAGEISVKMLRYIFRLPGDLREELLKYLAEEKFHLTVQQARKIAQACRRVNGGEDGRWRDIFQKALDFSSQSRQRAEEFLRLLDGWAYPRLTEWRKKFKQEKQDLNLWSELKVEPPENFEGDSLKFQFNCKNAKQLKKAIDSLERSRDLLEFV